MDSSAGIVKSPLTDRTSVELVRRYRTDAICAAWSERLGIDVTAEFSGIDRFDLYRCSESGLLFFHPPITGSDGLYAKLQRVEGYYQSEKWEFDQALRDLPPNAELLEVGCGRGFFLALLPPGVRKRALGIELNAEAVQWAQSNGLNAQNMDLAVIAESRPAHYDVVCSFQVLEHVADPRSFLENCVKALRPGGLLLLGVPNADGYLRYADEILDLPPHHVTQWSLRAFEYLQRIFPLSKERHSYQRLTQFETGMYLAAMRKRLREQGSPLWWVAHSRLGRSLSQRLLQAGSHRLLRGHSIYASFRKVAP